MGRAEFWGAGAISSMREGLGQTRGEGDLNPARAGWLKSGCYHRGWGQQARLISLLVLFGYSSVPKIIDEALAASCK